MFFVFFSMLLKQCMCIDLDIYIKTHFFLTFFFEKLGLYKIEWHCLGSCDHGSTHKVTQPGTLFWKMQLQKKNKKQNRLSWPGCPEVTVEATIASTTTTLHMQWLCERWVRLKKKMLLRVFAFGHKHRTTQLVNNDKSCTFSGFRARGLGSRFTAGSLSEECAKKKKN